MSNPLRRFISNFFKKPVPESYIVEILLDDEWKAVAMSFPSHQAGYDYAKYNYSSAWQKGNVRVRVI